MGPILFLIYGNEIFLSDPQVKLPLFAYATCIFHSNKNKQTLQNNLDSSLENITN